MVIKKPYAFLIKHFRLIHGLLFVMLIFLMTKTISIYSFFSGYANNHTYLNQYNLAGIYVTPLMYILAVLAILVLFVIYFILSIKEKSNKIYLAGILYYIVLIIFFIYIHSVFKGLEEASLDYETVRFFRDISVIILLPQIILLFIILGRTLGFNLKQFEFKKDLEELEIDVSDNEEVELTLGNDTYKIARFLRKSLRLTKYFLIENRLFVIAVSSLFILGISVFIYSKISVYQESYNTGELINVSTLSFKVGDSFITNDNTNNNIYVVVNVNVKNNANEKAALTRDSFKLKINNNLIIPQYGVTANFSDLGVAFEPININANTEKNYVVVFKIDEDNIENDYLFKIKNLTYDRNGKANYYKDVVIRPENLNTIKDNGKFALDSKVDFNGSILKNSSLTIKSADIAESFQEPYKYSINNKVVDGIYVIKPEVTNKGPRTVLKLQVEFNLDENSYANKVIKEPADLFEKYGILRYRYQGSYYDIPLEKIKTDYKVQLYSFMEIPQDIQTANKIDLVLTIRGMKYTINLK